jgi:1-acyl-sn-glycerol-3-phosphate acyltransferase
MWKWFCGKLIRILGWTTVNGLIPEKKAIIIGVPHTSGWDFVMSYLFYASKGGVAKIIVKKEFFFWPFGPIIRRMGGIPVDRSKGSTVVKQVIDEMNKQDVFHLAITPEGTRKLTKRWKAGFHTIARATGATVYLAFFDHGRKQVGWIEKLELTDDAQADIKRMKAYYRERNVIGKFPELFTTEE